MLYMFYLGGGGGGGGGGKKQNGCRNICFLTFAYLRL